MKILIVSTHITGGAFKDHRKPRNGIEARQHSWIKILKKKGIDVHVLCTGKIDPVFLEYATFHSVSELSRDEVLELHGPKEAVAMSRRVGKAYIDQAKIINPDFCWSNASTTTVPAAISKFIPTTHMIPDWIPSPMFLQGIVRNCMTITENGGRVYASPWIRAKHFEFSDTMDNPPPHTYISDDADVYTTMDPKIWEMDVVPNEGKTLMVGRCHPQKNFGKIAKAGIEFDAYVSGADFPNIIKTLDKSENTVLHHNETRDQLLLEYQKCSTCLVARPDESLGLIAIETLLFGGIPITFVDKAGQTHAADHYINQVTDLGVKPVAYDDPEWVLDLKIKLVYVNSLSFDDRKSIAESARKHFSEDSWYDEFWKVLSKSKVPAAPLDLF